MKASIILPVINETSSLEKTAKIITDENHDDLGEIIIMTAVKTTPESIAVINKLKNEYPNLIKAYRQELPFLGGAMRDAFTRSQGDWTLMMASDLETDPHAVKDLIREAKTGNWDIVTVTRWTQKGGFKGYNPVKFVLNFAFQNLFRLLYWTNLSDLTYGFRIFRTDLIKKIKWEEVRHPFLLETILKPLKLKQRVKEIPAKWEARKEGESQNTFFRNFEYIKIGIKVLRSKKEDLLV